MIRVSSISEYMYCPVKLYLKFTREDDIQTQDMMAGKLTHEVRRGFEETIKRNIWHINENLEFEDISDLIFDEVHQFIEKVSQKYSNAGKIDLNVLKDLCRNLEDDLKLESQFMALKVKRILNMTKKRGPEITDMLFPQSLLEFPLQNEELNLNGVVDKIEIINGIYYPIEIKTGMPPTKGVWEQHALQVAAYAALIDYELNKEALVGFVEYTKLGERRPVVIDAKLHGKLFDVLDKMNIMFDKGEIPEFKPNKNKCEKCEYIEVCEFALKMI